MPIKISKDGIEVYSTQDELPVELWKDGGTQQFKWPDIGYETWCRVTVCRDCKYRQAEVNDENASVSFWCGKRGFDIDDINEFFCKDGTI